MDETLVCIMCPIGCDLTAIRKGEGWEIDGNRCEKGPAFAREELLDPKRNIATSIPIDGAVFHALSVRLSRPIPRELIPGVIDEIHRFRIDAPVSGGQVLIPDVLSSGADVIATRTVRAREA